MPASAVWQTFVSVAVLQSSGSHLSKESLQISTCKIIQNIVLVHLSYQYVNLFLLPFNTVFSTSTYSYLLYNQFR